MCRLSEIFGLRKIDVVDECLPVVETHKSASTCSASAALLERSPLRRKPPAHILIDEDVSRLHEVLAGAELRRVLVFAN